MYGADCIPSGANQRVKIRKNILITQKLILNLNDIAMNGIACSVATRVQRISFSWQSDKT